MQTENPSALPADDGEKLTRVSVHLTARAMEWLEVACEITGDTHTDTIGRAVSLYGMLQDNVVKMNSASSIMFKQPDGSYISVIARHIK